MSDFDAFDSLYNPVVVCALDGDILFVNDAWESYGSDRGRDYDGVGMNYFECCTETSTSSLLQDQLKDLVDGDRDSFVLEYPCHGPLEDDWFKAFCSIAEIDGEMSLVIEHVNISEQKVLENEVSRLQSFLTSHTEYMNHEVRNKLAIISGHVELVRDKVAKSYPEVIDDHVLSIMNAIDEVTVLMNNHDPTSPIFASPNIREADIHSVIIQSVSRVAKDDLSFEVNVSGKFLADEVQVKHLIDNLVLNSIENSVNGQSDIVIDNIDSDSVTGFYVSDSGKGFPVSGSVIDFNESDFGVGLDIVQRIAENHDWSIKFMNTDRGGRVEITGLKTVEEALEE